jgi:hypothetical protein
VHVTQVRGREEPVIAYAVPDPSTIVELAELAELAEVAEPAELIAVSTGRDEISDETVV